MRAVPIYAQATLIGALVLAWSLQLWNADPKVPFYYVMGGDKYLGLALIKTFTETGWYVTNPRLGAPGAMDLHDFPLADTGVFLILKALSVVTDDPALLHNLFYLTTYFLVIWTSLAVFRRLGVGDQIAAAGSILFAFAPYHFWRGAIHGNLANYYAVPLVALVAIWLGRGIPIFFRGAGIRRARWAPAWGRAVPAVLSALLVSLSGPYYAFFGAYFLLVSGLIAVLRRPRAYRALNAMVLAGVVTASFAAQLVPNLIHARRHGPNPSVANRRLIDYYLYALRFDDLIRPVTGHRLAFLNSVPWRRSGGGQEVDWSIVSEERCGNEAVLFSPLGFAGLIGFGVLLATALRGPVRPVRGRRARLLADLAGLNLAGLLFALMGGFGEVVAAHLTSAIRCSNRMSIFLEFFSIFALVLLADGLRARLSLRPRGALLFATAMWAVVSLAMVDQAPGVLVPEHARDRALYREDARFFGRVESSVAPGAMIFQFPATPFPECGPLHAMPDYDHARGYLHTSRPRWSFGAMRGREAGRWQAAIARMSPDVALLRLSDAGFVGITINRAGYPDRGDAFVRAVSALLPGPPIRNSDGSLLYFSIPKAR